MSELEHPSPMNADAERLYLSLVEHLPVYVARKNLQGEITFANKAFCDLVNLAPDAVLGKTDFDLFPKELAEKYRLNDKWVQTTGNTFADIEKNFSGGETHYFQVRKTPVHNPNGQVIGTQVIFWDVSEHKRAEAKLDQERQLLNALLANTPDNIYFKDQDGRFIRISRAKAQRMALNHPADAVGKTDRDFFPEEHARKARLDEMEIMQTGRSVVSKEEQLEWPNGSRSWVSTTKAPLRNYLGEVVGTFGISRDITSRKHFEAAQREAKEAAEAANQAKSDFLAHMSHEIRTPMNAILGLTDLALESNLDEMQREYLTTVLSSAESLLGIINQVLDFSKIEADKIELEKVVFDAHELIVQSAKTFGFRAEEKGLSLEWNIDRQVPRQLIGDPTRFRQVLVNLIGNAVKFTSAGSVTVRASANRREADHVELQLAVTDTGIGIAPEKLDLVFEEFQQADSSTTRQFGGTGLGLAISARLCKLLGGRCWVESTLGTGTTFYFTAQFGVRSDQREELPSDISGRNQQQTLPPGLRILLAEDGAANQMLVVGILQRFQSQVYVAGDGEEAVRLAQQHPFDVILMDVQMPNKDGLQATKEIRHQPGPNQTTSVIAITAHAMDEDRQRCLNAGMDAFLTKPVRKQALVDAILDVLPNLDSAPTDDDDLSFEINDSPPAAIPVEWQTALDSLDGDADLLRTVAQACLGELQQRLNEMKTAIQQQDATSLQRAAHSLKGSTRLFDNHQIEDVAVRIENAAKANDFAVAESLLPDCRERVDVFSQRIQTFLDAGG
ncbi:MAG: PAS domain-containing protein [Planctomycetales bacterium]|nr:PAS domain-containing protein [Planctomycetales bacterium]